MLKNHSQGGAYFEVFTPQQKDALSQWKVTGTILKEYDKEIKSSSYILDGTATTTKMQLPNDSKLSLHLIQRYLVVQVILKAGADFSMELGVSDMKSGKRRLLFSTAQKDIQSTPLHAKVPLTIVKRGIWLNLCLDLVSMVGEVWRGETFKFLDSITVSANCHLRKIFTTKSQPPDDDDAEQYGCSLPNNVGEIEPIPKQCQFAMDVQNFTQLLFIDKILHAERLRGGGGEDVRGSLTSTLDLDLSSSGRRSFSTPSDSFHIAFGSKVTGVRASQNAAKKSSRERQVTWQEIDNYSGWLL